MLSIFQPTYLSTPVENLFIEEFMVKAPGEFVKVYLYGLRFAFFPMEGSQLTCEDFAKALHIEPDVVINAFCYWDRAGIVQLVSQEPLSVQYLPVQQGFQNRVEHRELYRYQELNQNLQAVVGAQRLITHEDFQMVYEWVEQLGVEPDAIPLLVEFFMDSKHNRKLSFAYMDKAIRGLVEEKKITTLQQAEQYIHGETLCRPARDVLALWNIHRNATLEEGSLWAKWTREMKFDRQGILLVAKHMSHVANPNFRYLDRMLETLHQQGITRTADIRQYYLRQDEESDRLAPILRSLGYRGAHSPQIREMAREWFALGFSQGALEKLAASLSREGRNRPEDLDALVRRQGKAGAVSDEAVDRLLADAAESRAAFSELLAAWGDDRAPTARERRAWSRWREAGHSPELIALAAEFSQSAQDRVRYMSAILARWKEEGIATPEAARASYGPSRSGAAGSGKLEFERDASAYDQYFDEEEDRLP